jgi:hypothetical protein
MNEFEAISGVYVHNVHELAATAEGGLVPTAIIHSSFEEVLVLDSRTFAAKNPVSLFDSSEYQSTGLLFFPSLYTTSPSNPIWSMLGIACIDAPEQSAAAAVVHKRKAWNALHMASHLRSSFYQNMVNKDNNLLRLAALATSTPFSTAPESVAVGAHYSVAGVRQFCSHSVRMHDVDGSTMFIASANSIMAQAGSNADKITCLQNVEAVMQDEQLVGSIIRAQASVPDATGRLALQACTVVEKTEAEYEAIVSTTNAPIAISLASYTAGATITSSSIATWATHYVPNCGSFFTCASTSIQTSDARTLFFNISTGPTQSANIDISTPYSLNRYGNETMIRVVNHGKTRTECAAPVLYVLASSVNYNIATGSWAIVGVSWATQYRQSLQSLITVQIYFWGDSNAASSSRLISLPALLAAGLFAYFARRF